MNEPQPSTYPALESIADRRRFLYVLGQLPRWARKAHYWPRRHLPRLGWKALLYRRSASIGKDLQRNDVRSLALLGTLKALDKIGFVMEGDQLWRFRFRPRAVPHWAAVLYCQHPHNARRARRAPRPPSESYPDHGET